MLVLTVPPAHAQENTKETADERRCTGVWRATVEERIASCTALIQSGHYQAANLAILHENRGAAYRLQGDVANARADFTRAIAVNPSYVRAYANRASLALAQRDFDGAIADLDAAIKLDPAGSALLVAASRSAIAPSKSRWASARLARLA